MRTRIPSSPQFLNARLAVMRDTPNDLTISFSEGTRAEAPISRVDVVEDVPLDLQVQGLQAAGDFTMIVPSLSCIYRYGQPEAIAQQGRQGAIVPA